MKDKGLLYRNLVERLPILIQSATNSSLWVLTDLNVSLFDNQIEIIDAVIDLTITKVAILQARGAGKTTATAFGLLKICLDRPKTKVGVFAPKAEQSYRIIKEITGQLSGRSQSFAYRQIDRKKSTTSRLIFKNGSEILAMSANEQTMQEGYHFDVVVLDECHQITDISVNQRIIPMLGSSPIAKIIKLGIPMYRNNFYESCHSSQYLHLKRDWTQCPILLTNGYVFYHGKELPKYVIDQMPSSLKSFYFPDDPTLHYSGSMTELDFKTQYGMEWVEDLALLLGEEEQKRLASGQHNVLGRAKPDEKYYFGLDTAPGGLGTGRDLDRTALAIWRMGSNKMKEKVAAFEWQGNILQQIAEIRAILDPKTGLFPCVAGLVDYSNIGITIVESFKQQGISIGGINFGRAQPKTGKNFKNAMVDAFLLELQEGRISYPNISQMAGQFVMNTSFQEWCHLERHRRGGLNDDIHAATGFHDDHVSADLCAVWAMEDLESDLLPLHNASVPSWSWENMSTTLGIRSSPQSKYFSGLSNPKPSDPFGGVFGEPLK